MKINRHVHISIVANDTPETIHKKENDWEVDPVIPSEELHDQSHTLVIESKLEVDIAISGVEKVEAQNLKAEVAGIMELQKLWNLIEKDRPIRGNIMCKTKEVQCLDFCLKI